MSTYKKNRKHNAYKWLAICIIPAIAVLLIVVLFGAKLAPSLLYRAFMNSNEQDYTCWVKSKSKIVIMGSSMARHNIIPGIIEDEMGYKRAEVVNIGWNAATPLANLTTYIKNLHYLKDSSVVYYTLDPWIVSPKYYVHRPLERSLWNICQWFIMKGQNDFTDGYLLPLKNTVNIIRRGVIWGR